MSTIKPSRKSSKKKITKTVKSAEEKRQIYEQKKQLKLKIQQERNAKKGDPANKDKFYCTNKELLAEMEKWRDSNPEHPELRQPSEELGLMMMAIANKVLNRSEFRNYPQSLKEDMCSFGYYKIIRGLKNYDFRFTNVFSFFTTAFYNAYLTVLKKHYKHQNIKKDLTIKFLSEMEEYPGMNSNSTLRKCIENYIGDCSED